MHFATNVFINCPFDLSYRKLLRPLLFCLLDLGFEPRIALERLDSAEQRVMKIIELIEASKFGIHDLSRLQSGSKGEFYRLNMPFELGLDFACRQFKGSKWSAKRLLILEETPFRYQAALSDLAGSDISTHGSKPQKVVEAVRNWINNQNGLNADGPAKIWARFNDFMAANHDALIERGFSKKDITAVDIAELITQMKAWIFTNPSN